ncbi:MAG: dihydroxyacetone kinase subunit L [Chloroflexi bacterium]|nr:dihydroxyacetone kinase subunit L [Chloroflexota bacterium]
MRTPTADGTGTPPTTGTEAIDAHGSIEPISADALRAGFRRARRSIDRHAAALTRLDAVLGDGDHGDNLAIGFRAVDELLDELPASTLPSELLRSIGHRLVGAVGGASGPLYGTACIEAGFRAGTATTLDPVLAAAMLRAAAAGLARRGRCAVGDKTILDTLAPAADAFAGAIEAGLDAATAQRRALTAARTGMRATRPLVARRGLALRLGPRSAGHLDPGAVSCYLLLAALAQR